jgi:hypothetical protein
MLVSKLIPSIHAKAPVQLYVPLPITKAHFLTHGFFTSPRFTLSQIYQQDKCSKYCQLLNPKLSDSLTCNSGSSHILLFAGLLARCQYVTGRSCDWPPRHGFSWFSSVSKHMLRWFPVATACLSCTPPDLNSSKNQICLF